MKNVLLTLSICLVLSSCGSSSSGSGTTTGACASSLITGSWAGTISGHVDVMTFAADCSGSSTYCASTHTVPNITATPGSVVVTVSATNGASGCLPVGQTSCAYTVNSTTLGFNCGPGAIYYTKQ